MRDRIDRLVDNLGKTIVGKQEAIRLVLVALFSGGHALLEDVPGWAKHCWPSRWRVPSTVGSSEFNARLTCCPLT